MTAKLNNPDQSKCVAYVDKRRKWYIVARWLLAVIVPTLIVTTISIAAIRLAPTLHENVLDLIRQWGAARFAAFAVCAFSGFVLLIGFAFQPSQKSLTDRLTREYHIKWQFFKEDYDELLEAVSEFTHSVNQQKYGDLINLDKEIFDLFRAIDKRVTLFFDSDDFLTEVEEFYDAARKILESDPNALFICEPKILPVIASLQEKFERRNYPDCFHLFRQVKRLLSSARSRVPQQCRFDFANILDILESDLEALRDRILAIPEAALIWENIRHHEEIEYSAQLVAEEEQRRTEIAEADRRSASDAREEQSMAARRVAKESIVIRKNLEERNREK